MMGTFLTANVYAAPQADTLSQIQSQGYITVGADTTYAPFESINATTNTPEGFDVDLALIIGHDLGVNVHYVTSAWDPIIPNLQAKQFDIILSAMTITADRAKEVNFTRWYYNSSQAWLVPASNPKNLNSLADLNQTGVNVGFQTGTTSDIYVNESLTKATPHSYADITLALTDLKNGNIDAVLGDWAVLAKFAGDNNNAYIIPGEFSPELFGIAVRIGDTALLNALNSALDKLLGTNVNSPTPSDLYNTIYRKWFGVNDQYYTGTVTDAPLPTDITLQYGQGASPGFEVYAIFALALIPVIRRYKKSNH